MVIRGREFEYGPEGQGMKKGQWVTDLLSGKRDSNPRLRRGNAPFHILPGPPTEGDSGPRVRVWSGRSGHEKRSVGY